MLVRRARTTKPRKPCGSQENWKTRLNAQPLVVFGGELVRGVEDKEEEEKENEGRVGEEEEEEEEEDEEE